MDEATLSVPGTREAATDAAVAVSEVTVTTKGRVRCGAARAGAAPVELEGVAPDDVVRVEYTNGFVEWIRADDFYQEHAAAPRRDAGPGDVLEIDPSANAHTATDRGVAAVAIAALEFFGIDLKGKAAQALCRSFENKRIGDAGSRLLRCSLGATFDLTELSANGEVPRSDRPMLVFIHGTASSTRGSYGALWDPRMSPGGQALRAALHARFEDRVYALEHRTLTESPVQNAITLAQALPAGANLALVTYSRGGLVGDLLCLGTRLRDGGDKLTEALLDAICDGDKTVAVPPGLQPVAREDDSAEFYAALRKDLGTLIELLDHKHFTIERYVRVASPSRGTTLASGRFDRWLSILNFVADRSGVPLLGDGIDILLGLVKERTDPRTLPGIEAMMPGSAVTRVVNYPAIKVAADLTVISGDIEPGSLWARIGNFVVNRFYQGDNDLVVNTGSMYGGSPRAQRQASFMLDRGPDVNHFNYFSNDKTVGLIGVALASSGAPAGFQPIARARIATPARSAVLRSQTQGPRPVLIVLPGTMGSQLEAGDDRVWLDYFDLATGGLGQLRIEAGDISPLDLLDDFYGEFLVHAARTHEVRPYPYDWRISVTATADEFALELAQHLNTCQRTGQPLRIAAHSMGGLVVRATFAKHPNLWQQFRDIAGSRFVMFGTPNRGSLEAMRWLSGFNATLRKLSLLDLTRSINGVIDVVRRYPGLLELLPADDPTHDFTRPQLWRDLKAALRTTWPLAQADDLARLPATWQLIADSPTDRDRMLYVAGCGDSTVTGYRLLPDTNPPWAGTLKMQRIEFDYTAEGDGTVSWASGLLDDVPTYYVAATEHDALLGDGAPFGAYMDLLVDGRTTRLPQSPPLRGVRGAGAGAPAPAATVPPYLPGPLELESFTFGGGAPQPPTDSQRQARLSVSVRHGDLTYAGYPVVVGHYQGDSILSAERVLDRKLGGILSRRMRLGLYPGPRNTCAVFLQHPETDRAVDERTAGAIVVGLGQVGELGPGTLQAGMTQAMLELALAVDQLTDSTFGPAGQCRAVKVNCLLIGTGMAGMEIRESLESLLRGILAANESLATQELADRVRIAEVEFIELFEDVAIVAARQLTAIVSETDLAESIEWSPATVLDSGNGRRRSYFDDRGDWWRRLQVVHDPAHDVLRFTDYGKSARAERDMVRDELHAVDRFIEEVCGTTVRDRRTAQTLFEMLLPNRLKGLAPEAHDRVLLLDERSARYPWELLEDRWSRRGEPPAIAGGLLRQLVAEDYRERPMWAAGDAALVVGNPALTAAAHNKFPPLPGARDEAEAVADELQSEKFAADLCVDADGGEILKRLHGDAWRILHLAGHGVHEYEVTRTTRENGQLVSHTRSVSGMVIGADHFLTAGVVAQMRNVPQLVFINCCHLGATTTDDTVPPGSPALAANLAVAFIRMGVRAVIAAGWAVDDRAAEKFARTFYREMSDGRAFGDAVLEARRATYQTHPNVNTWGAYQCYGDPDFRINRIERHGGHDHTTYVSPLELVTDLQNLARGLAMGEPVAAARARIERFEAAIPPDLKDAWLARADVAAAMGEAFGQAGFYADAASWLAVVMRANDAAATVRSVEKLANWAIRDALARWQAAQARSPVDRDAATAAVTALETLRGYLEALDAIGPTVERKSILGSAAKRLARMHASRKRDRQQAVKAMRRYYDDAFELGRQSGAEDFYPLVNRLAADAVLSWDNTGSTSKLLAAAERDAASAIALATRAMTENPGFWPLVVEPDCEVALALIASTAAARDTHTAAAIAGYRHAFANATSTSQRNSVLEHLDFLFEMATAERAAEAVATLVEVRGALADFRAVHDPVDD